MNMTIRESRYTTINNRFVTCYSVILEAKNGHNLIIPCRPDFSAEYFDMSEQEYIDFAKEEFNAITLGELHLMDRELFEGFIVFMNESDCKKFIEWLEPQLVMAKLAKDI